MKTDTTQSNLLRDLISTWLIKHRHSAPRWTMTAMADSTGIKYDALRRWVGGGNISADNLARAEAWAMDRDLYTPGHMTAEGAELLAMFGGAHNGTF